MGWGPRLWQGTFEGFEDTWLRWRDAGGAIILTGEEHAAAAAERARLAEERVRELEAELRRVQGEPPAERR
jgi:hypothetical protein